METTIKELRTACGLTQAETSALTDIPLRTYKMYENDPSKKGTIKYNYILQKLEEYSLVDENHGLLTVDDITEACSEIFRNYDVQYCYLFGSYAKDTASETSDVDLLISTKETGLKFYGLAERLREHLKKKVDLISLDQLNDNPELLNEILKDGVKIYEQR